MPKVKPKLTEIQIKNAKPKEAPYIHLLTPEKSVIELDCAGKLEGKSVKVDKDMVARVSFNKASGYTTIELKEDKGCQLFSESKRLIGGLPCGSEIAVKGSAKEVRKKLGLPKLPFKS